jgi:pyruvate dehydrogenase E2 component (dihydrolipoamide acetyltransferase)
MAKEVRMPKQGNTVESCFLGEWHVKEGDYVTVGTPLFSYETDKAAFEYEAEDEGVILSIRYQEGDVVDVLETVCLIGKEGESVDAPVESTKEEKTPELKKEVEPVEITKPEAFLQREGKRAISPRARRLAKKQNIEPNELVGTGPNARIIERDVRAFDRYAERNVSGEGEMDQAEFTVKKLSNIRKIIGKTMTESLQNSAQLTHSLSFDVTDVLAYRNMLKEKEANNELPRITLNDIIIYAVSRVLQDFEDLNAHYVAGELRLFESVHIGVATDTNRGLMVPTLRNVERLSLVELAVEAKRLSSLAIAGSIDPDLLRNATFTISNLGPFGIEHFTPIINPPQTGILGVNTIETKIRMTGGSFSFYQAMGLSLTYDHRVIDGAGASRFLQALKTYLESFSTRIDQERVGLKKGR